MRAKLAELVLWIGFLQWQIRTNGQVSVPAPVVQGYGNIEQWDAVLAYDQQEPMLDTLVALGRARLVDCRWVSAGV